MGVTRQLSISYLIAGSPSVTPASSGVTYSAGNLLATWPQSPCDR